MVQKLEKLIFKKTWIKMYRFFLCAILISALTACLFPYSPAEAKVTTNLELTTDTVTDIPPNCTPSGIHYSEIQSHIENFVKENEGELAGVSLTVFCGQEDLYTGYFGHSDIDNNISVDENTVYEWGSITKLLTWVSVMQLYEKDLIDFDKDIREYLPEGFLKKLSYDEPITMLNLMNHNAGWQETIYNIEASKEKDIVSLGDALRKSEPRQVHRPGEVTAYSNWGAALAGYIVENITGMDFADYVKENIFKPLNMEHTSIKSDYSDNLWVKEQRNKTLCYSVTPSGKSNLGNCISYILIYPAGAAVGTLSDLTKFAKMFTAATDEECMVFESVETLKFMKEASSFYGESDLPRNCHGMWVSHFTKNTLGHSGATNGFTTSFMFEPQSGLGLVIMTNEPGESTINSGLPYLLYGSYKKNSRLKDQIINVEIDISGCYLSHRTISSGPMSLLSALNYMPVGKSKNKNEYPVIDGITITRLTNNEFILEDKNGGSYLFYLSVNNDNYIFQAEGMDYYRQSPVHTYAKFTSAIYPLLLMAVLVVAGIIFLIILMIRRVKKKEAKETDSLCQKLYILQHILGIVFGIFFLLSYFSGIISPTGKAAVPVCILTLLFALTFTVLGFFILGRATYLIKNKDLRVWGSIKYYLISISEFITVFCIFYWQMFFFWKG